MIMVRSPRPKMSRRRLEGRRVLQFAYTVVVQAPFEMPVTVNYARKYARDHSIKAPAVIKIKRVSGVVDSYFLGHKGMFSLDYAELHWMTFPSLRQIVDTVGRKQLFDDLREGDLSHNEESYNASYAFI